MHACTNFSVSVTSSMDEAKKIAEYLSSRIPSPASIQAREDFISPSVDVYENYEIVWYEDILELAKDMAKTMPDIDFTMYGTVDASSSSGEYMDFTITYRAHKMEAAVSRWYFMGTKKTPKQRRSVVNLDD